MTQLHVLYSFPLRLGVRGVGTTAWHQITGLIKQGVRVSVYAGSCEKPIDGLNLIRETLTPCGIKLPISLLGREAATILHDRIVAKELRRLHTKNRIDVVHCWPLGAEHTVEAAKSLGIKTFLERPNAHTRFAYEVVARECKKLGVKLSRSDPHVYSKKRLQREELEYEIADFLLCPSDFVAKTFLEHGIPERRIVRHQYGFDSSEYFVHENESVQNGRQFKAVFVGSCEPRKGLHYALDAWLASNASEDGIFYIVGRFVPGYRKLLEAKLRHRSIKEFGFSEDVPLLLRQCNTLILPSVEEGSALVTYEAQACGCVLLVSDASGAHCVNMYDGLVHRPGDVDTLRRHIDLISGDRQFYQRLRRNSILGCKKLSWDGAAEVLVRAYNRCLSE